MASFRDRLVATIHAAAPVLELPDILVIGSEVILEKLVTDRTGEKGERDLLVALGLIALAAQGISTRPRRFAHACLLICGTPFDRI